MKVQLLKLWRKIERGFKRLYRPSIMRRLAATNRSSTKSILNPKGPVVSLTTFGSRIDSVFYAIESIAEGSLLPSKITLWVDPSIAANSLPQSLQNLMKRGLEVAATHDVGPHTKYFGEVHRDDTKDLPFVTADDDILYPRYWLERLVKSFNEAPSEIHCFRAHKMRFDERGKLTRYSDWASCENMQASHLHFSTGVCGVIFPPEMRNELQKRKKAFLDCCPKADDIWLNYIAYCANIKVRQVVTVPKRFYEIPGTREEALANINNGQGGNDQQLAATYAENDLTRLASLANSQT